MQTEHATRHETSVVQAISRGQDIERHQKRGYTSRMRALTTVGTVLLSATLLLAGCGSVGSNLGTGPSNARNNPVNSAAANQNANPPFANRLKDLPATPDPNFDPTTAQSSIYTGLTVYKADGTKVTLDASKTPILFEAYWCPHCQRTLVLLNKNRSQLAQFPIVVSMGFAPGTSLSQAVNITQQEMNYFHIQNVQEYYYLGTQSNELVPVGFPTLAFPGQGSVVTLAGEHTLQVWEQGLRA